MNANRENPVELIVEHVVNTEYKNLPPVTVSKVKTFLLDTIGVAMAGTSGAGVEDLLKLAQSWGASDESSILLTGET